MKFTEAYEALEAGKCLKSTVKGNDMYFKQVCSLSEKFCRGRKANTTSGFAGVYKSYIPEKWMTSVRVPVGYNFDSPELAHAARERTIKELREKGFLK